MNKKSFVSILLLLTTYSASFSQTYTVNQQSQSVNINVPVIEKPVYIEKYRTVYVNKPRVAKKLEKPIQLLGYLWVYPEDLGDFKQIPVGVINSINSQSPYGMNNWRIPTPDELSVLEANADKVGLGDDIYLATDHRNGVLRLVSTGKTISEKAAIRSEIISSGKGKLIGDVVWSTSLYKDCGFKVFCYYHMDYDNYIGKHDFPIGWRLPTLNEFEKLLDSNSRSVNATINALKELLSDELHPNNLQSGLYQFLCKNNGSFYYAKTYVRESGNDKTEFDYYRNTDGWYDYGYVLLVFDENLL